MSDFRGPAGTPTYNFGESNPPPQDCKVKFNEAWQKTTNTVEILPNSGRNNKNNTLKATADNKGISTKNPPGGPLVFDFDYFNFQRIFLRDQLLKSIDFL